jgi:hypothetical protein
MPRLTLDPVVSANETSNVEIILTSNAAGKESNKNTIQIESGSSVGTITINAKVGGGTVFQSTGVVIDLSAPQSVNINGYYEAFQFVPAGLTAATTFTVHVVQGR